MQFDLDAIFSNYALVKKVNKFTMLKKIGFVDIDYSVLDKEEQYHICLYCKRCKSVLCRVDGSYDDPKLIDHSKVINEIISHEGYHLVKTYFNDIKSLNETVL